eukprot:IDg22693t1
MHSAVNLVVTGQRSFNGFVDDIMQTLEILMCDEDRKKDSMNH